MRRWYAVYTQARMEAWAQANLRERGIEVYLPRYLKRRRHARRTDFVAAPFFPRYLFARADLESTSRRAIASAPGVAYLVSFGERPAPLADGIIAELRGREADDGLIPLDQDDFRRGEEVRVVAGALRDHQGLFECATDGERVIVLLDLLGRSVRATLPAGVLGPAR